MAAKHLSYQSNSGETVSCPAKAGAGSSKPLDDNPNCVLKEQRVYLQQCVNEPGCYACFCDKNWHIDQAKWWPTTGRALLILQRAELKTCARDVEIVEQALDGDDCCQDLAEVRRINARASYSHVETTTEYRDDVEWCTDHVKYCFDTDHGIEPGFLVIDCDKTFKVSSIKNEKNPAKLIEVFASEH